MIDRNENRPGYKKTKVGWIPEEWDYAPLRRLSKHSVMNGLFKKPNEYGTGTFLVNVTDTYKGIAIDVDTLDRVKTSPSELTRYANKLGDIFFVRSSLKREGVGNCCILLDDRIPTVFECHLIRFRPHPQRVNSLFVVYLCTSASIRKQLLSAARTTTMTTLPQGDIERCLIPLPSLPEQKKIAEVLSRWDEAIEQTRSLIDAKKRRKKSLMQQLLTGKKRLPGFIKSSRRIPYRFFDLPADWQCPQIGKIARECTERNGHGEKMTVISCSKHMGFVESAQYFGKQVFSEDTSNYKVIRRGWFGYPSNHIEEGSIGLLTTHDQGIVSPIYTVFRTNAEINPEFLYALFKTETYRHIFTISTNASVDRRGSLRWREFSRIQVPLPSLEEQHRIAGVLFAADNEIKTLEQKLAALEKQKRGLMQKLLTGEIRVNR